MSMNIGYILLDMRPSTARVDKIALTLLLGWDWDLQLFVLDLQGPLKMCCMLWDFRYGETSLYDYTSPHEAT